MNLDFETGISNNFAGEVKPEHVVKLTQLWNLHSDRLPALEIEGALYGPVRSESWSSSACFAPAVVSSAYRVYVIARL